MTDARQLVIFDCDGVLVDSERLAVQMDLQVLHELGWELSEAEVIERLMGVLTATPEAFTASSGCYERRAVATL